MHPDGLPQSHEECFFTNPIEKALSADLSNLLKDSLSEIDSSIRVVTVHTEFARAYDK